MKSSSSKEMDGKNGESNNKKSAFTERDRKSSFIQPTTPAAFHGAGGVTQPPAETVLNATKKPSGGVQQLSSHQLVSRADGRVLRTKNSSFKGEDTDLHTNTHL